MTSFAELKKIINDKFCNNLYLLFGYSKNNVEFKEKVLELIERIAFVGAREARPHAENRFHSEFSRSRLIQTLEDTFNHPLTETTPFMIDSAIHSYAFLMKRRMINETILSKMTVVLVDSMSFPIYSETDSKKINRSFFAFYCLIESRSFYLFLFLFIPFYFSLIILLR